MPPALLDVGGVLRVAKSEKQLDPDVCGRRPQPRWLEVSLCPGPAGDPSLPLLSRQCVSSVGRICARRINRCRTSRYHGWYNPDSGVGSMVSGRRSAWRAFYQRIGHVFVIAAVGPEARADPRGFERAVTSALTRLEEVDQS